MCGHVYMCRVDRLLVEMDIWVVIGEMNVWFIYYVGQARGGGHGQMQVPSSRACA